MRIREVKELIAHGILLRQLRDQRDKLSSLIHQESPPDCDNSSIMQIQLREYSRLCRKVRQIKRIQRYLADNQQLTK